MACSRTGCVSSKVSNDPLLQGAAERDTQRVGEPRLERLYLKALLNDAGARRRKFGIPGGKRGVLRREFGSLRIHQCLQGGDGRAGCGLLLG